MSNFRQYHDSKTQALIDSEEYTFLDLIYKHGLN